jgi:hypothetical protein
MRSIALAGLFVLFGLVQCFAQPNESTGYRGYPWGTGAEAIAGLDMKAGDEVLSFSTRPADGKTFIVGEYSFTANKEVIWIFFEKRFGGVLAMFTIESFQPVSEAIVKTFGQPNLVNSDDKYTYYYWRGTVGRVTVTMPKNKGEEIGVGYSSYEFLLNKTGPR